MNDTNLDALAAQLPPEYEGHWIAEVVRNFGRARGLTEDHQLMDLWQEAVICAMHKITEAKTKDVNPISYVKRGVTSRLVDLTRRPEPETTAEEDVLVAVAEGSMGRQDSRRDDFQAALALVLEPEGVANPRFRRYWAAFCATNGSDRAVAQAMGISRHAAQTQYAMPFRTCFKAAYLLVKRLRG
ncbi:MAG: hypothetical protein MJ240_08930 [Kiritimatiellae bacterium]|nr:hypothetical protein [Kiritimatiellia bacterium]